MTDAAVGTRDEQALALPREIVDDIELKRLPLPGIVQKVSRLGRIVDDTELREFALYETIGYPDDHSVKFFSMTKRDKLRSPFYGSADVLLSLLKAANDRHQVLTTLATTQSASPSGLRSFLEAIDSSAGERLEFEIVQSNVIVLLHAMVSGHLHRLSFVTRQATMFEKAQGDIDRLLSGLGSEALGKLDAAHDRLRAGDAESISHALTSCRRLLDQAADALFPATGETRNVGGNEVQLGQQQVLNRLKAYVDDHTDSDSRRTRLKQVLTNLWSRTSAGVHASVSSDEARYLYLTIYMTIGELISMLSEAPLEVTVA